MNADSQPHPRVTVNGRELPPEAVIFELTRLVRFYRRHMPEAQVHAQMPLLRRKAVEQAIGARLLLEEAARTEPPVTDDEVDERVAAMRRQAGGAAKFTALLRKQKLELAVLREQIRRGRQADRLVARVTAGVPEPTEAEMRAHFEAHAAEYAAAAEGVGASAPAVAYEQAQPRVREFLLHAARGAALAAHIAALRGRSRIEIVPAP